MPLIFIQGTMSSSKTALLIMFRNSLLIDSSNIKIALPFLGSNKINIKSRAPLDSVEVDIIIKEGDTLWVNEITNNIKFILIDECQFLDSKNILILKTLSERITIICYGLLTDFLRNEFEGSKILNSLADKLIKIPSPCNLCFENLAEFNMRECNGKMLLEGPLLLLKDKVNYISVCEYCYNLKYKEALKK